MKEPTKESVLASSSVRYFCKNIIRAAEKHDLVDVIKDLELALAVLRLENDKWLENTTPHGFTNNMMGQLHDMVNG